MPDEGHLPQPAGLRPGIPLVSPPAPCVGDFPAHTFHDLMESEQRLLLLAWLLPPGWITQEQVAWIGQLSVKEALAAADGLLQRQLLVAAPQPPRYCLADMVRPSVYVLASCPENQTAVRSMLERLSGLLLGTPGAAAIAYHLLSLRAWLPLSLTECVRIIDAAWPCIRHRGMWSLWLPVLNALCEEAAQTSDPETASLLFRWSGVAEREMGNYEQAEGDLLEALRLSAGWTMQQQYSRVLLELAVVYRYRYRWETARSIALYARSLCEQLHDLSGMEWALHELAQLTLDTELPAEALELLRSVRPTARAISLICQAHLALGNPREALALARRAADLAVGDRPNQARAQAALGQVYLELADLKQAEESLTLALGLLEQLGDRRTYCRAAVNLARIYQLQDRLDEAAALLQNVIDRLQASDDHQGLTAALQNLLAVYVSQVDQALATGNDQAIALLVPVIRKVDERWQALLQRQAHDPGRRRWK